MPVFSHPGAPPGAIKLRGDDFDGWALFSHVVTVRSPSGAPVTRRCELGEKLFRYRYRGEREHLVTIVETFVTAIAACFPDIHASFDCLIVPPPPPSRPDYARVVELAAELSRASGIFSAQFAVRRDGGARPSFSFASAGAAGFFSGKTTLVIDDLYRSGRTLHALCRFLKRDGGALALSALVGSAAAPAAGRSGNTIL